VVTEVHTAWWIVGDILIPLGPAALITGLLGFFGEHSAALLVVVFILAFAVVSLVSLGWLGYRQESRRLTAATHQSGDLQWTIRDLFIHICPDLEKKPEDPGLRRETASQLLDALASAKLAMRGRKIERPASRRQPLTVIDSNYWTDVLFTFWFLDKTGSPVDVRNNKTGVEYANLCVDRAAVLNVWPLPIPLREAARKAYEQTRGTDIAKVAEGFGKTPEGILRYYEHSLFLQHPIYAQKLPSTISEIVPPHVKPTLYLLEGGAGLGFHGSKEPAYIDLRMHIADLEAFISWATDPNTTLTSAG
jgi:hypothetical protein